MHSFAPSLSFLLLLILPNFLQIHFPRAFAADLHAESQRDISNPSYLDPVARAVGTGLELTARQALSGHLQSASQRRRHAALNDAVRARSQQTNSSELSLYPGKRASGASFTHFVTGLGACGGRNVPSDYVVALNQEQWDGGAHCNAPVTITINGKTVHASIVDKCEKCGWNNIDFTDGLFEAFAPLGAGTIYGQWEYGSGAASSSTTSTPISTSTSTTSTTISTTSSAKSSTSATQSSTSASSTNNSVPTVISTPSLDNMGNLEQAAMALLGMAGLALAALPTPTG